MIFNWLSSGSSSLRKQYSDHTIARLLRHRLGSVGFFVVASAVLLAIFAPFVAPYDPAFQDMASELMPPSAEYWFGTDQYGRDILSRVVFGTRIAIVVGGSAALIGGIVGVLIGLLAGYYGGAADAIIMRSLDIILAFPSVLLALLLVVIMGAGTVTVSLALATSAIPIFGRLTRASVLQLRSQEYVLAAKLFGSSGPRIMLTHLLRNSASPILVQASLVVGVSVLLESTLSFLGLGIQPPTASWGLMLNESRAFLDFAPWFAIAPGVALTIFLVGLVLLADALRDVLDVGDVPGSMQ